MTGLHVLSVGEGDLKFSFDKKNPVERIRAARIVTDMLKRGYALLVEVAPGEYQRIERFDENTCEYIIADYAPEESQTHGEEIISEEIELTQAAPASEPAGTKRGRGRPRKTVEKRLSAESTKAVGVARTSGG